MGLSWRVIVLLVNALVGAASTAAFLLFDVPELWKHGKAITLVVFFLFVIFMAWAIYQVLREKQAVENRLMSIDRLKELEESFSQMRLGHLGTTWSAYWTLNDGASDRVWWVSVEATPTATAEQLRHQFESLLIAANNVIASHYADRIPQIKASQDSLPRWLETVVAVTHQKFIESGSGTHHGVHYVGGQIDDILTLSSLTCGRFRAEMTSISDMK